MSTPAWWPTAEQKERADKAHADALAAKEARTPSRPLVVWNNIVTCDRCGGDVHVTTDGRRVHADTITSADYWPFTDTPERDDTHVTFRCGTPDVNGELFCRNLIAVDLSTEWWTTNSVYIDRLMTEGVDIP